jgi:pilus assembly protein CpaF
LLSKYFSYIVLLLPENDYETAQALITLSGMVLLPTSADLLSIAHAKLLFDVLKTSHLPFNLVKPVLFIPNAKHNLKNDNIEKLINMSIFAEIHYDNDTVVSSINESKPAVLNSPNSSFSEGINKLAKALANNDIFVNVSSDLNKNNTGINNSKQVHNTSFLKIKEKAHKDLIAKLSFYDIDLNLLSDKTKISQVHEKTKNALQDILAKEATLSQEDRVLLAEELLNDVLGLGCLEEFLKDPEITEIMVNGKDDIYVEKKGKLHYTGASFSSESSLRTVIDRIISPLGRRVDELSPLVDARLADGSRVNVIIPPLSLIGPVITIRKFSKKKLSIDDLVGFGALTKEMGQFLDICVKLRKNIVISGGTGSGKTTLLNVTSGFIPEDERVCTIEDSAELKLPQRHVISLESRPASLEGTGEIPIRRLVINALRMRPDRIVVGECRGGETLDMLQAMNTGHDGSLTTLHSNSPKDAISRMSTMALMSGTELPDKAIKEQIASAVQVIVQLNRISDGSRKVTEIAELTGMKEGVISLSTIFKFEQEGIKDGKVIGRFTASGNIPSFIEEVKTHGLSIDTNIFKR